MACPASVRPTISAPTGAPSKVIDLSPYLRRRRRDRRQAVLHTILAVWTQYLSLASLVLYALLRAILAGGVPLGQYSGPLALLWPLSFLLLLTSYCCDLLLWRKEWAAAPEG